MALEKWMIKGDPPISAPYPYELRQSGDYLSSVYRAGRTGWAKLPPHGWSALEFPCMAARWWVATVSRTSLHIPKITEVDPPDDMLDSAEELQPHYQKFTKFVSHLGYFLEEQPFDRNRPPPSFVGPDNNTRIHLRLSPRQQWISVEPAMGLEHGDVSFYVPVCHPRIAAILIACGLWWLTEYREGHNRSSAWLPRVVLEGFGTSNHGLWQPILMHAQHPPTIMATTRTGHGLTQFTLYNGRSMSGSEVIEKIDTRNEYTPAGYINLQYVQSWQQAQHGIKGPSPTKVIYDEVSEKYLKRVSPGFKKMAVPKSLITDQP